MTPPANPTLVLVEGRSDELAIEAAALRCGRDLRGAGVSIVAMGGATNVARVVAEHAGTNARLAGLCDAGEARLFERSLEPASIFVCDRDLEDELIRALGPQRVERLIEGEGELGSLRTLQQMPFHRQRTTAQHLHRFIGTRSGRKHRYAPLLTAALAPDELPRPLLDLLDHVT